MAVPHIKTARKPTKLKLTSKLTATQQKNLKLGRERFLKIYNEEWKKRDPDSPPKLPSRIKLNPDLSVEEKMMQNAMGYNPKNEKISDSHNIMIADMAQAFGHIKGVKREPLFGSDPQKLAELYMPKDDILIHEMDGRGKRPIWIHVGSEVPEKEMRWIAKGLVREPSGELAMRHDQRKYMKAQEAVERHMDAKRIKD